jgi:hypothetical protein
MGMLRGALCVGMLCGFGCGDKGEGEGGDEAPKGPVLGDMELPVSLRTDGAAPTDARKLEMSPTEMRLDDQTVMMLEGGRVPASELQAGVLPKLKAALASPAKASLALHLHAMLPYDTLAQVLTTAHEAGVRDAVFRVRKVGATPDTGWLRADGYSLTGRTDGEVPIPSVAPRKWDEFTAQWTTINQACSSARTGSCAYVPTTPAKGGNLKIVLFAAGQGININFHRVGLSPEELAAEEAARLAEVAKQKEDVVQGRKEAMDLEDALIGGPPPAEALFQFRNNEGLKAPSPVSATLAPLCGANACGVVLSADGNTKVLGVVSLIGAAFPDGTAAPHLAFEQPWTEKPRPVAPAAAPAAAP